jgi:hypothetical protein
MSSSRLANIDKMIEHRPDKLVELSPDIIISFLLKVLILMFDYLRPSPTTKGAPIALITSNQYQAFYFTYK